MGNEDKLLCDDLLFERCVLVCFVLQHALGNFSAPLMGCVFLHVMESRTVQMVLTRGTVVFIYYYMFESKIF